MPYHLRIKPKSSSVEEVRLDLTKEQLEKRFLSPYREGKPIFIGGRNIPPDDIERIRITFTTKGSSDILPMVEEDLARMRKLRGLVTKTSPAWHVANRGQEVTDEFIAGPPGSGLIPGRAFVRSAEAGLKISAETANIITRTSGEVVTASGAAIGFLRDVKNGYEDLRATFNLRQTDINNQFQLPEKLEGLDDSLNLIRLKMSEMEGQLETITEQTRPKTLKAKIIAYIIDNIFGIIIGSIFTALGLSLLRWIGFL